MPALKVEILTSVDSSGLQSAAAGLKEVRDSVTTLAEAMQPLADRAAAAGEALGTTAEQAAPVGKALGEVGDKATEAGDKLRKAGDDAAWTAAQIQPAVAKFDADPLVAFAQQARVAGDAIDDDAQGLIAFAKGAEGAAASVKPLAAATKDQAAASTAAGVSSEKMGQIFGGLARASQGGREGLLGLAMAARAFWAALSGGTVAVIAAIVAALAGLAVGFASTGKSAEEAKQKVEELNKANLEAFKLQLESITTAAKDGTNALIEEAAQADRFADAKLARDKVALDVEAKATGMSAEEKAQRLLKLERDREDQRINQTKATKERIAGIEEDASNEFAQKQIDADTKLNIALAAKPEAERLAKRERELTMRTGTFDPEIERAAAEELQNTRTRLAALKKTLPVSEASIPGLREQKAKADEAATAQAEKAKKARADATNYEAEQAALAPVTQDRRRLENKARIDLTPAEKEKIEKAKAKARAEMEFKMRALGPAAVANRIAGGDKSIDLDAARKLFPDYKFVAPAAGTPTAQPAPSSQGTGVYRPGEALPRTTAGVDRFGEALPGPTLGAGNQMTRGPLKPGSDNKQFEQSADKINESMTKAAEQKAPDLTPAADASEKIAEAQKTQAGAIDDYTQRHAAAAESFAGFAASAVATIQFQSEKINALSARVSTLASQVSAMRSQRTS